MVELRLDGLEVRLVPTHRKQDELAVMMSAGIHDSFLAIHRKQTDVLGAGADGQAWPRFRGGFFERRRIVYRFAFKHDGRSRRGDHVRIVERRFRQDEQITLYEAHQVIRRQAILHRAFALDAD